MAAFTTKRDKESKNEHFNFFSNFFFHYSEMSITLSAEYDSSSQDLVREVLIHAMFSACKPFFTNHFACISKFF